MYFCVACDAVPHSGFEIVATFERVAIAVLLVGHVERLVAAQPAVSNSNTQRSLNTQQNFIFPMNEKMTRTK